MQVQSICENSITLYTSLDELNSRGICESCLNSRNTAAMIREGFNSLGIAADGAIEVETYINGRAVLIFAHICKITETASALFRFDNLENLISATHSLTSSPPATLMCKDDAYYLVLHRTCDNTAVHILSEFSTPVPEASLFYANLHEHGKLLHSGNAVEMLKETFSPVVQENSLFADSVNPID